MGDAEAAMELLTTRYSENLVGVLSCYDRIVITEPPRLSRRLIGLSHAIMADPADWA